MILSFWLSYSLSPESSVVTSSGEQNNSEVALLSGRGFPPFALQGPLFSPNACGKPGYHETVAGQPRVHTPRRARVSSTWRRRAPARSLLQTRLPLPCRRRPRSCPLLRFRRRPPWAHSLARPATRTCCPSQYFMGRWTQKTHSWPPVRRRFRSC